MTRSGAQRKLDYSDYAALPDDGSRREILDGGLHVTPAPGTGHQHASKRLQRQLEDYFERRLIGEVFSAPFDVILSRHDVVQPDLVVVARREQLSQRGVEGIPLLVVEILSPSTRVHDRGRKALRYAELGIPHLWFVDPEARRMECHRLENRRYGIVTSGEGTASLLPPDWPGLVIELAALWR